MVRPIRKGLAVSGCAADAVLCTEALSVLCSEAAAGLGLREALLLLLALEGLEALLRDAGLLRDDV